MLPDWIKPDVSFTEAITGTKYHIRAIVDDVYVAMRYWRSHKQRWEYVIEHETWFDVRRDQLNH